MTTRVGRLLVVEDDAELAAGFRAALATDAREIQVADGADAAVELIRQFRPDLVVLDVVLRQGTAFDVLEAARPLEPRPTIIAISGSVGPDASFRLAQQGVRTFLCKPFTAQALRDAVERALASAPDLTPLLRDSVGRAPAGSCRDARGLRCGGASADGSCFCDPACEYYGDCCLDYRTHC